MRISGITLQEEKRVDIALTYLYGIGRNNVHAILKKAEIDPSKRVKILSEDDQDIARTCPLGASEHDQTPGQREEKE